MTAKSYCLRSAAAVLAFWVALGPLCVARAQGRKPSPPPPAAAQPSDKAGLPGDAQIRLLVQSYMIALSQAILTGNYTVLHALGAPAFQQSNPPERLEQIFGNLASQNIDLTPIVLLTPVLSHPPAFSADGLLPVTGYYDTHPLQIHFDLTLQPVAGIWRLFAISVKAVPAPATTTAAARKK